MLGAFRGIGLTTSTPLACYSSYSLSREWEITGKPDASRTTDFVALKSPSLRGALRYHWCPIAFIVMAGSTTTSSIEYNRANDGIAMNIGMILGKMVRIISIVVPWTILCGIGLVCSWKCHKARTKIRDTKTKIRMRKKKISWCKSMIPCIIGVAASWDPNCHGSAASQGAIVRNRHSNVLNNSAIICLSILFCDCPKISKRLIDICVGFSNKRKQEAKATGRAWKHWSPYYRKFHRCTCATRPSWCYTWIGKSPHSRMTKVTCPPLLVRLRGSTKPIGDWRGKWAERCLRLLLPSWGTV